MGFVHLHNHSEYSLLDGSCKIGELVHRAKELGMNNTNFINATGLDAEGHISSAHDVAVMSAELIKHVLIKKYSTVWMDSLRDGKSELVNTNKSIPHVIAFDILNKSIKL